MRVVAQITKGYEELQEELKRFPAKQRAERMRVLASIGLYALRIENRSLMNMTGGPSQGGELDAQPQKSTPADPRRNRLKGKLRQSLERD